MASPLIDWLNRLLRRVPTWAVYSLGALPALWLLWLALSNGLGPDPVKVMERSLGEWGLRFLLASLAVTPLRRAGLNLLKFRRALGLLAFVYIALHLTVWIWPDMGLRWAQIWADIVKRPYILFGTAAFLCMVPLAATSSNAAIRRMGAPAWNRLHQLAYPALALGLLHFVILSRVWTVEVIVYAILGVGLLALRLPRLIGMGVRTGATAGQRAR
jgi:sulfoxide reductase heme-binding subunit YedZ